MDFLAQALQALPQAATHPFAFVAYIFLIAAWLITGLRVNRNRQLLQNIQHLPPKDRWPALQAEMGIVAVPAGLTAEQWLQQRRQTYYLISFLSLLAAAVVIFVIAVVTASSIERGTANLIELLEHREQQLADAFDEILEPNSGNNFFLG